jgi:ubiquitin C-terminal hydrolase
VLCEPFLFISAELPKFENESVSLESLLNDQFEQKSLYMPEENWECSKCKRKVVAISWKKISKLPKILFIHFQRSHDFVKNNATIEYPEKMGMLKYMLKRSERFYKLVGFINHYGDYENGHFTAASLDQKSKIWYEFNDSIVSRLSKARIHSRIAYILVYQKCKKKT